MGRDQFDDRAILSFPIAQIPEVAPKVLGNPAVVLPFIDRFRSIDVLHCLPDLITVATNKLRFGDLVRESGRPQPVTLWTRPETNRAFTSAIKQNRVLTVISEPGKRDYGVIGFKPNSHGSYFVFPRKLPRAPATKVIGINYQIVEQDVLHV